jgi:hypothetical protein
MKYNTDFIIIPTICVGIYSLYNLYKLNKKIEVLDNGINLIMSTHLLYMENRDEQTEQIKSINDILEQIALSTPFRGTGWQTKFIEEKIRRDLEHHLTPPEEMKFYDDEAGV